MDPFPAARFSDGGPSSAQATGERLASVTVAQPTLDPTDPFVSSASKKASDRLNGLFKSNSGDL